jgi:hypothetical protein
LVAVSYGNRIFHSPDNGDTWTEHNPIAAGANWEEVAYGNGVWIVGNSLFRNSEPWARSTNGTEWTVETQDIWPGSSSEVESVGYGNGIWIMGTNYGLLAYSVDDGESFQEIGPPAGWQAEAPYDTVASGIEDVTYLNGRFHIVGDHGQVAYADVPTESANWTTQSLGDFDFKRIYGGGGQLVAVTRDAGVDSCYTSTNGVQWTSCADVDALGGEGVYYSDGLWMRTVWRGSHYLESSVVGGEPWNPVVVDRAGARLLFVYGSCGTWVVGTHNDPGGNWLATSRNAGDSWAYWNLDGDVRIFDIAGNR